ncbi:MAG: hypothetical protein Kow00124_26390 [Anaerolineae bacterium]
MLALILAAVLMAGCALLGAGGPAEVQIDAAVSDADGMARVTTPSGVLDFQVSSGLSGERLAGVRIRVAAWGESRMVYAEDPAGQHLPVAVPLPGESVVRRLVMPPRTALGHNLTTADGVLNLADLTPLGTMDEAALHNWLERGPDEAVLIYLYNPISPLALTGAELEAFSTPFNNVTVLRAGGEPPDSQLGMVVVTLGHELFSTWQHREVDRYLATRIGLRPDTDLRGDLAFNWSYPVFQVFPAEEVLPLDEEGRATVIVTWRSTNPNPPPPWSIFLTSDMTDAVTIEPESALIGPDVPSQEFTVTVDRSRLPPGQHSVTLFIQPFSETFGLIEQSVQRRLDFTVQAAEAAEPTPTPGPQLESLTVSPPDPREGDILFVDAAGFTPREAVLIELMGQDFVFRDALPTATEEGSFSYAIDLSPVPAGDYTLTLTGTASQMRGEVSVSIAEKVADAIVARPELNLRLEPFPDSPVLEVLVQGDELTVIGVNGDDSWLEVIAPSGERGWVVTDLVDVNIDLATVPWNSNYPAPGP